MIAQQVELRRPAVTGISGGLPDLASERGVRSIGKITKLVGLTIESLGPVASVGDLVTIEYEGNNEQEQISAEVVGFRDNHLMLLPLDEGHGLRCGDRVIRRTRGFCIPVGDDLVGRVIDPIGRPLDGRGPIKSHRAWSIHRAAPHALQRQHVSEPLATGVNCIDAMLTCGKGQRVGIFAGSGVGKSSLLGMICRNAASDVNVVALIGERGKEVRDFITNILGKSGLSKSVLIVATADKPPLQRVKGAETAMAVAEYFRSQGRSVMLVMDSLTRYAMALREMGLATGEPAATRGYPPSVFARIPALLERAGNDHCGSITGFFTVLVEGDDMNDPIADTARGALDGHIILSRELAARGHFPSIDVLSSVSRSMNWLVSPEQMGLARDLRELIFTYQKAEDMINLGAYKPGNNDKIDNAVEKKEAIDRFLCQELQVTTAWDSVIKGLKEVVEQ